VIVVLEQDPAIVGDEHRPKGIIAIGHADLGQVDGPEKVLSIGVVHPVLQRSRAWSSSGFASTQRSPFGVASFFQKGASVFR